MMTKKREYPFSRETFLAWRRPRFGTANPTQFDNPVWLHFAETEEYSGLADYTFDVDARDIGPCWCNSRYGQSTTELADGRTIYIGGEHEDYYDPQFNIYNDVIVKHADGRYQIFGYPKSVFPPTDSHSATLYQNSIIIIGSIGYVDERRFGEIDVFQLNLDDYSMTKLNTTGECPGWLYGHDAWLMADGRTIKVLNGTLQSSERDYRDNHTIFQLDLRSLVWRKIRTQTPSAFSIFYRAQEKLGVDSLDYDTLPFPIHHFKSDPFKASFFIDDTRVLLTDEHNHVVVTISDRLSTDTLSTLKQHLVTEITNISTETPEITDKKSELYHAKVTINDTTLALPVILFDIDDDEALSDLRGLLPENSQGKYNLMRINQADFGGLTEGGKDSNEWRTWVENLLREHGVNFPYGIEKIELACTPHILGCRVNPIALWYVYFDGDELNAIIVEHHDDKGHRHHYVMADDYWLSETKGNTGEQGTLPHCDVSCDTSGNYRISQKGNITFSASGRQRALLSHNVYSAFGGWKNRFALLRRMIVVAFMPKVRQSRHSRIKK